VFSNITLEKQRAAISQVGVALSLLWESSKHLNLLFENKDGCFYFRRAWIRCDNTTFFSGASEP
jgi:hypothetical protein